MSTASFLPQQRELPARRMAERAEHLRGELQRSHPPRPRRRSVAIAFAVLVLGVVLLATPAFGLRDRIAHLFAGKPPSVIEHYFENQRHTGPNRPELEVLAKQARLAVQISISGYGHQSLWVAPIKGGGFCTTGPGCDPGRRVPLAVTLSVAGPTSRRSPNPREPRDVHVFIKGDTLARGAEYLAARYEDGSVDRDPITWIGRPIDAGFFIYEIPKSHWEPGKRLLALTAESADGHVLARDTKMARYFRQVQRANLALPAGVKPKLPPLPPKRVLCSETCRDPEGDAGSSLDITNVKVTKLGDSDLEVELTVHGAAALQADGALIALDLDQNPDTGSAYYGAEVEVALVGGENGREAEPVLYKAHGWDFRAVSLRQPPGMLEKPDAVGFSIPRSSLRPDTEPGFDIVAASVGRHPDTAPDIGTFEIEPKGGKHPPLGPDRRPPKLFAFDSLGVRDKDAKLEYWVLEGRGRTRQVFRIYRGQRLLKTIWTPLADANPFATAATTWRVPRTVRSDLRFSVRSFDAAGNKSAVAWATLFVR
jgi:hypothetical protein